MLINMDQDARIKRGEVGSDTPATTGVHTATPWHVGSDGVTIVKPHPQANSEFARQQGTIVARSCYSREESADTPKGGQWTEETRANAAFIVRAVNNFDALVDLARRAQHGTPGFILIDTADKILAAIATEAE